MEGALRAMHDHVATDGRRGPHRCPIGPSIMIKMGLRAWQPFTSEPTPSTIPLRPHPARCALGRGTCGTVATGLGHALVSGSRLDAGW